MSSPEDQIRLWVEEQIDEFINRPNFWIGAFQEYLSEAGIQSDLEAVLSMMVGVTYGFVATNTKNVFDRPMTGPENTMVKKLIQRRAFELRMNFINEINR